MGNRRIGRKRLYGVEKQGQSIDLSAGAGISGAIARATQHRQGQELITEILIDLGTSAADILDGSAAKGVMGVASASDSSITRLTVAKFGVITEIRVVCLEAYSTGISIGLDDAALGTDATDISTTEAGLRDLETVGTDASKAYDDTASTANKYLYLCQGDSSGGVNSATALSQGKFAIYIHGFAVPADL